MLVHPDLNRVEHIMHGEKLHQNTTTHGITISMLWIMKGSDSMSTLRVHLIDEGKTESAQIVGVMQLGRNGVVHGDCPQRKKWKN